MVDVSKITIFDQKIELLYFQNQLVNINKAFSNYFAQVETAFQPTGSPQNSRFGRPPGRARVGPKKDNLLI
jgi:hypothetical protein